MNVFARLIPGGANPAAPTSAAPAVEDPLFQSIPSHLDRDARPERLFGLTNFGATCYANSVLQALYFCEPFRDLVVSQAGDQPAEVPPQLKVSAAKGPVPVLKSKHEAPTADSPPSASAPTTNDILNGAAALDLTQPVDPSTTLLSTLGNLFATIARHPNRTGVIAPQAFILQLKRENELFRSSMHQDAHEFLNYLLNTIAEQLEKEKQQATPVGSPAHETAPVKSRDYAGSLHGMRQHTTWIQRLFEGVLTNETRCLTCETVTSRDEAFLDLSIDIEENTSLTACLRQFSASEMLYSKNKFSCDTCCGLQEAEKRMKIKHLPDVLALHLKRFKWQEDQQTFTKLSYRVVFPFELRLFNTVDGSSESDQLYTLWAIVVHIGAGLHHGHYITLIKSMGRWLLFDDDAISQIDESDITKYYGDTSPTGSGYVLFYQRAQPVPISQPGTGSDVPLERTISHLSSVSSKVPSSPHLSFSERSADFAPRPVRKQSLAPIQTGLSLTRPPDSPTEPSSPTFKTAGPSPVRERKGFFGLGKRAPSAKLSAEELPAANGRRGSHSEHSDTEALATDRSSVGTSDHSAAPSHSHELSTATTTFDSDHASSVSSTHHQGASPAYTFPASTPSEPMHSLPPSSPSVPPQERKMLGRLFGRSKKSLPSDDEPTSEEKRQLFSRTRKQSKLK